MIYYPKAVRLCTFQASILLLVGSQVISQYPSYMTICNIKLRQRICSHCDYAGSVKLAFFLVVNVSLIVPDVARNEHGLILRMTKFVCIPLIHLVLQVPKLCNF